MDPRFPYDYTVMINNKLSNKKLAICPNSEGTEPVPFKNYNGSHSFGRMESTKRWHLIWYVWEFIGHLWYISYDFDSFIKIIAENESPEGPGQNDFNNYLVSMKQDSKTVYCQHILAHFNVLWAKCGENQETWNTKLAELREAFNVYIKKRLIDYKDGVHPVFGKWKQTLISTYGEENWGSYLWQCANFDELGHFITEHNQYFKKNEDAKTLLCHLNLPETTFNFAGLESQQVASIDDDSNIVIWARGVKNTEGTETFIYPATPIEWSTGGRGIIPDYKRHNTIFPNGIKTWLGKCKEKNVEVKFIVIEGDISTDNYENDKIMTNTGKLIVCSNKSDHYLGVSHRLKKPVCGKDESLVDFARRMQ